MKPEQHIAELAQAEMDLAKQKTEKAKLLFRRTFIGMGIFLALAGVITAIQAQGWIKLSGAVLFFSGLELIFVQRFVNRKT